MKHMVSEGDRSGIHTPDPAAKARQVMTAARERIDWALQHWGTSTNEEINVEVVAAIDRLNVVARLLAKKV